MGVKLSQMNLMIKFNSSDYRKTFKVLTSADKKKIPLVIAIQVFFGLLDLIGVALIGVIGALAVTGVEAKAPGNRVGKVLSVLNIESLNLQAQATILGVMAASVLVIKTLLSILVIRKTLHFLSNRGAQLSSKLIANLLSQPLLSIQQRSSTVRTDHRCERHFRRSDWINSQFDR